MSTLWGSNIKRLREALGLTRAQLAAQVGVSPATVSDWESGVIKNIDGRNLIRAAQVLRVSAEALFDEAASSQKDQTNTKEEMAAPVFPIGLARVPVVGTAQLGDEGYWHELEYPPGNGDGYALFPTNDKNAFGLHVEGDSMRPRFKPGEVVIIEPNKRVESGNEVCVKTTDGRVMVKVLDWRRQGMLQLSSVNEDHKPITLKEQQVEFVYRVIGSVQADMHFQ
jgi:phage repressor protein C with HTH and peptisase S24 domain